MRALTLFVQNIGTLQSIRVIIIVNFHICYTYFRIIVPGARARTQKATLNYMQFKFFNTRRKRRAKLGDTFLVNSECDKTFQL